MGAAPPSDTVRLAPAVWAALACPGCGDALKRDAGGATCPSCDTTYTRNPAGSLDLRLRGPKTFHLDIEYSPDGPPPDKTVFAPLERRRPPEVDFSGANIPWHLNDVLMSWFPKARSGESLALDLGCGDGANRPAVEAAGFIYAGLDVNSPDAMILGDAHALPFQDGCFEFVISIAVLEHLSHPGIALREVVRVLRPGSVFIGSVSFLEPFHGNSYYHHTHLGLLNNLLDAGLTVDRVAPVVSWHSLIALAKLGLFPRMPGPLQTAAVMPVYALHRLWWHVAGWFSTQASEKNRLLRTTGSFTFVARKPPA